MNRPIEIRTFLNPAFCGHVIRHCIHKYEKNTSEPFPYPYTFLILPIILHRDTRKQIPSISRQPFHPWLMKNSDVLINLHQRTQNLITITKESILFLHFMNAIKIKNGNIKLLDFKVKTKESDSSEVLDCFTKAGTLGKWFAGVGQPITLFSMLGIIP